MTRNFYVIVYDVVDDKRRLKIAKTLESMGTRVQYSVFEVYLTVQELEKLSKRLVKLVKEKEDGLRIYQLCESCREKARKIGQGSLSAPPGVVIV